MEHLENGAQAVLAMGAGRDGVDAAPGAVQGGRVMKKWIVAVMLVALLIVGCAKTVTVESHGVFDASMFRTVETQGDWKIVADRKTGVMYAVSAGGYNRGTFTLLVDVDGNPLTYKEGE